MTIAQEISAALREAATDTGLGPLFATIIRQGAKIGPDWNPTYGADVTYAVAIVDGQIKARDASGTLTGEVRRKLMIEAGVIVPLKGDQITVRGVTHTIDEVMTLAPGGVDLMYSVTLER